ncbi:MAG TPA: hypothetical protein VL359_16030, partial [bacterium]|nr:hypothetical protein [bacterium]
MINDYISLSSRQGFNKSLGHFRLVTGIVQQMGEGTNLAEIIDELEKAKDVDKAQIAPILNAIVVDRQSYSTLSFNLARDIQDFAPLVAELEKWNRLDIIVAYHHPQLGISLINPKLSSHWEGIREFNRDELIVIYIKALDEADRALEADALVAMKNLFQGRAVQGTERFGGAAVAKPAPPPPRPAAPAAKPAPAVAARPAPVPLPPMAPSAAVAPAAAPAEAVPSVPEAAPSMEAGGKRKVTPK